MSTLLSIGQIQLEAIDGQGATYATASKVFRAYLDPNFRKYGIIFSGATQETKIVVEDLMRDGRFSDFFGTTASELEKRRMLGSQFLAICRDHSSKLSGEGFANFFVLTKNNRMVAEDLSNVFVAYVIVCDKGKLEANLYEFRRAIVWDGNCGHRVFSPKQ